MWFIGNLSLPLAAKITSKLNIKMCATSKFP